jgi:hypothetical protein
MKKAYFNGAVLVSCENEILHREGDRKKLVANFQGRDALETANMCLAGLQGLNLGTPIADGEQVFFDAYRSYALHQFACDALTLIVGMLQKTPQSGIQQENSLAEIKELLQGSDVYITDPVKAKKLKELLGWQHDSRPSN